MALELARGVYGFGKGQLGGSSSKASLPSESGVEFANEFISLSSTGADDNDNSSPHKIPVHSQWSSIATVQGTKSCN
eukprot:1158050-Pelagomonas_calceolata.AAC.10